jgi:hypothetical protein
MADNNVWLWNLKGGAQIEYKLSGNTEKGNDEYGTEMKNVVYFDKIYGSGRRLVANDAVIVVTDSRA